MIIKTPPIKGLKSRIPIIIPVKGRGCINHGFRVQGLAILGPERKLNQGFGGSARHEPASMLHNKNGGFSKLGGF